MKHSLACAMQTARKTQCSRPSGLSVLVKEYHLFSNPFTIRVCDQHKLVLTHYAGPYTLADGRPVIAAQEERCQRQPSDR